MDTALFTLTSENGFSLSTSVINELSSPKTANFNKTAIMNRSSGVVTFASSDNVVLSVQFYFVALGGNLLTAQDVENIVLGLESLTYPLNPGIYGPPKCQITIGAGARYKNWPCVCQSVDPQIVEDHLWDKDGNTMTATVTCQFLGYEVQNVSSKKWGGAGLKSWKQLSFDSSSLGT